MMAIKQISLMLIYNSLVESRLRYGILAWSTATAKQINRLKVLQNKALRFINFSSIDIGFKNIGKIYDEIGYYFTPACIVIKQ